jgi:hypothetical protein
MAALLGHAGERHAPADGQLLRYRNVRRITYRRYDHLWERLDQYLPWVRAQQISMHWIRHTTLTWVEVSGVASAASFGSLRERALPAVQHAALKQARSYRRPCTLRDLGCHHPLASSRTMMHPVPLQRIPA